MELVLSESDAHISRQLIAEGADVAGLNVFPMWRHSVSEAVRVFPDYLKRRGAEGRLGVAAVLHDTPLTLADFDALEAVGLLVVEVPDMFRDENDTGIGEYLSRQIGDLDAALRADSTMLPESTSVFADDEYWPVEPTASDPGSESEILKSLNDSEAQLDGF